MKTIIATVIPMLLIVWVSASPFPEERGVPEALAAKEAFERSLEPSQMQWWTENQDELFDSLMSADMDTRSAEDDDADDPKLNEDIMRSLNPVQKRYWSHLLQKANHVTKRSMMPDILARDTGADGRGACGGGCTLSSQCEVYSGSRNCRCSWFSCKWF